MLHNYCNNATESSSKAGRDIRVDYICELLHNCNWRGNPALVYAKSEGGLSSKNFKYKVTRNFYEKMVIDCNFIRGGGYIWAVVVSKIPKESRATLTK